MDHFALIVPENFIQATRDSGYKSLGSALAELVDNAFEAKATSVDIDIAKANDATRPDVHVVVTDNGTGMDPQTLRHALQFGWSSRFNRRDSHGRYGMGLPNASLSHARRVELTSSRDGKVAGSTYLDVDEIAAGRVGTIPAPHSVMWGARIANGVRASGTMVVWRRCDRLLDRKLGPLTRKLRSELGRLFRYQLWAKKRISVNGQPVTPFDPLFLNEGANLRGAEPHGPELIFPVALSATTRARTSTIRVRFTELPVAKWHSLSNQEKNSQGIAKNAGVSIVRAGREIDCGWFFMGQKRKENYDDWWRCEVRFEPDLDEWFGVTHTKQEIHPTEQLLAILTPDMERIARDLNGRARRAFMVAKEEASRRKSEAQAERFDNLLEPPEIDSGDQLPPSQQLLNVLRGRIRGIQYRLKFQRLEGDWLFCPELKGTRLTMVLNDAHPFVRQVWPLESDRGGNGTDSQRSLEVLLLAAARAEFAHGLSAKSRRQVIDFRKTWSKILATFLS